MAYNKLKINQIAVWDMHKYILIPASLHLGWAKLPCWMQKFTSYTYRRDGRAATLISPNPTTWSRTCGATASLVARRQLAELNSRLLHELNTKTNQNYGSVERRQSLSYIFTETAVAQFQNTWSYVTIRPDLEPMHSLNSHRHMQVILGLWNEIRPCWHGRGQDLPIPS